MYITQIMFSIKDTHLQTCSDNFFFIAHVITFSSKYIGTSGSRQMGFIIKITFSVGV